MESIYVKDVFFRIFGSSEDSSIETLGNGRTSSGDCPKDESDWLGSSSLNHRALEDACQRLLMGVGPNTGIIISVGNAASDSISRFDQYDMLPGKLAYEHDLRGPSLYLSTTCSSFGYMLNIAAHFLRTSDLDNVLLLSSNMELPESSPALSQIISKDNSCRPFTLHRDGSIAGRGYGGVLLSTSTSTQFSSNKSCEIELLDCSVSTAGRERASFGAPSRSAQLSNIRSSYRRAGISPAACVYTEAHGTGTVIGDAIEARVLREVFETVREPVWIGSAKEHVGHLDATAGLASICRVVNSFSGGLIPTSLPRNVASQDFDLLGPSLRLVPQSVEWPDSAVTGVHMVGFSGASAHAIFRMRKETV